VLLLRLFALVCADVHWESEHRLQLELRASDDLQHTRGRRLLLDRLSQIALELLDAHALVYVTCIHDEILSTGWLPW
jgi:hypothetical protein